MASELLHSLHFILSAIQHLNNRFYLERLCGENGSEEIFLLLLCI